MVGRHKSTLLWLALPATVFLGAFFILPLVFVVADSLSDGGSAYGRVASDPVFWAISSLCICRKNQNGFAQL